MTRTHAALLLAFERYVRRSIEAGLAFEEKLSLLEAHKVAYLLQLSGWSFGLSFAQGHFGPYTDSLDRLISSVEGHFLHGYGDGTSGSRAALTLDETALAEAHALLDDDREFWAALERFKQVVVGYEFPYGVELLATVHFAAIELVNGSVDADKVTDAIQGWSPRKGRIFKPVQARLAFDRLVDRGLLPA